MAGTIRNCALRRRCGGIQQLGNACAAEQGPGKLVTIPPPSPTSSADSAINAFIVRKSPLDAASAKRRSSFWCTSCGTL